MSRIETMLQRAHEKHQRGATRDAESMYRRILSRDPKQKHALLLLGSLCGQDGRWAQALHFLDRAAAVAPDDPQVQYNLGVARAAADDTEGAIEAYDRALAADPRNASAWFNRGLELLRLGRRDDARHALESACVHDAAHVGARHQLAVLCFDERDFPRAAAAWEAATELEPRNAEHWHNLAMAHQSLERFDDAVVAYERALECAPAGPDTDTRAASLTNLAALHRQRGAIDDAIACCESAIDHDPTYADAHNNLGNAHLERDAIDAAIACFERAIELKPDHPEASRVLEEIRGRFIGTSPLLARADDARTS